MDDKTRSNFDLNIWNPQVMTENEIYETCDDVLGSAAENHYCTPVSTNNGLSNVRSTTALTPSHPRNPIRRRGLSWKTSAAILLSVLVLLIFGILVCCIGFAMSEVSRLQSEINEIKGEIANLREMDQNNMANLSLVIAQEKVSREEELISLTESLVSFVTTLSNSTAVNISQLESSLQNDIDNLRDILSANLSSVANVSASRYMMLILALNSSFSSFSGEFDQFRSEYQTNVQNIQDNFDAQSEDINTTNSAINLLAMKINSDLHNLNYSVALNFGLVRADVEELHLTINNVTNNIRNSTQEEIDKLKSTHSADITRIESTVQGNFSALEGKITQTEYHTMSNISSLKESVNSSLLDLHMSLDTSISSLRFELGNVEYELALATHSNLTSLSTTFRSNLDAIAREVSGNISLLEKITEERISTLSSSTVNDIRELQLETQSNLTELVMVTQRDISDALVQSQAQIGHLETNVFTNLSQLSILIRNNELAFETMINTSVAALESEFLASTNNLSGSIVTLHKEVRENVSNLLSLVDVVNSTFLEKIMDTKQDLVSQTITNISLLEEATSTRFNRVENTLARNITSVESTTQDQIKTLTNQTTQQLGSLRTEIHSIFIQITESTANNISTLESQTAALLNKFRTEFQSNLSEVRGDSAQELTSTRAMLESKIGRIENTTLDKIRELQIANNQTTIYIMELDMRISEKFSALLFDIAENLTSLSSSIQRQINNLNHTDAEIIASARETENVISDITSHNNETRRLIDVIEENILNLTKILSAHQVNLTSIKYELNDLESSTNITFGKLRVNLEEFSEESISNFTSLFNITRAINERLSVITEDIQSDLVDLESRSARNVSTLKSEVNIILQGLELNLTRNIVDLESYLSTNITLLETEVTNSLSLVNVSLGGKLENLSKETDERVSELMQLLANETVRITNYVNRSIQILSNDNTYLSVGISNVSMLVSSITSELTTVTSELNSTKTNVANYQQNVSKEIQDIYKSLQMTNSSLLVNYNSALNLSLQLQDTFAGNLTNLQNQLFSSVQELENYTLVLTNNLNSSLIQLHLNTSQSIAELLDSIRKNEELLSEMTGNLSAHVEMGLRLLRESVGYNFTSVQVQLDTVAINTSSAFEELDNRVTSQLRGTNSSLNALDGSLYNLSQSVEQLERNVSSVSNEVEQVGAEFKNFTNSPLNLYDNCYEENRECMFQPQSPNYYTGSCLTANLPINRTGFQTMDVKCDYLENTSQFSFLRSSSVAIDGGNMACHCAIFSISSIQGTLISVTDFNERQLQWRCALKVTRCPLSRTRT